MIPNRVRPLVYIGFLLLVSVSQVFASAPPVSIQIQTTSETIQDVRYQIGSIPGKSWKRVPTGGTPLVLEGFDSNTEYLFIQQSENENVWGKILAYQYDQKGNVWNLVTL